MKDDFWNRMVDQLRVGSMAYEAPDYNFLKKMTKREEIEELREDIRVLYDDYMVHDDQATELFEEIIKKTLRLSFLRGDDLI